MASGNWSVLRLMADGAGPGETASQHPKPAAARKDQPDTPRVTHIFASFLRLGLTAFGGPAMVAYIGRMAVERRRWLDRRTFQDGVALVQALPGATAMQMAAYVGLKSRGIRGALAAYAGFGLPAFLLMLLFSALYSSTRQLPAAAALFAGLQVTVVAIVAGATWSFGRDILKNLRSVLLATAAAALLWFGLSPFLVIAGAALAGLLLFAGMTAAPRAYRAAPARLKLLPLATLVGLVAAAMLLLFFVSRARFDLAALMMRIDLFAFGGGFASLPLMLFEVVDVRRWMSSNTFMDGIALGQVTPGPIVMTTTFVGYLVYGLSGAVIATAAVFTPSFLIIVAVTPFYDRLKSAAWFTRATRGILASFVGLLFYVTVKFALAVPWDLPRAFLGAAVLAALLAKVDILYVVIFAAALSLLLLR